jgi:hypothetical protein
LVITWQGIAMYRLSGFADIDAWGILTRIFEVKKPLETDMLT